MPKIAVDECPAGPAMDAAVAEVLGVGRIKVIEDGTLPDKTYPFPAYSIDIAEAWKLAKKERMRLGWTEDWDTPYAACRQSICEYGDRHPMAICRAFLKANGVEFVEVPE